MARSLISRTPFGKPDVGIHHLAKVSETEHFDRLRRYREAWNFYLGRHWGWERSEDEPFVTLNYIRKIVDEHMVFFMGNGFKVTIPDDPGTPNREDEDREFVRVLLEETWRRNRLNLFALECAQMGAVTGDVFLRVSWETRDPLEEPYARVDIIPSQYVFPSFGGPHGVDRKKMTSVLIIFPVYRTVQPPPGSFDTASQELEYRGERWTAETVQTWSTGASEPEEKPNPLGEIPLIHIPNFPLAGEFYGISDVMDLVDLQKELNEKSTDISDVVNYQGSPVTVVTGAKLANLERGANKIWGLPEGANVKNLGLEGELRASVDYKDGIKQSLMEIGGIPDEILGTFGKHASGVQVSLRYMPLLQRRKVKIATYSLGLRLVNRLILRYQEMMDPQFSNKFKQLSGNRYRTEVTFPHPLPRDESIELDNSEKRQKLGITSKRFEMEKMGLSQSEIDKILKDRMEEKEQEMKMNFEFHEKYGMEIEKPRKEQENRSGNPNPVRPNPEVQGEKVSITQEQKLK